jgi:hypothetical protein
MLIESRAVRDYLNSNVQPTTINNASIPSLSSKSPAPWSPPKSYSVPMNPIPGLIIFLLGIMMSSHHQSSMVSTMIHKQWGSMFVGAAFARAVTYILLYLSPPTSYLPGRPPSELITAFCLIAGGMLFMESNKDTVAAMEGRGLDAMFTFTVSIGLSALLMAWTVTVMAVKGWALGREQQRRVDESQHGREAVV